MANLTAWKGRGARFLALILWIGSVLNAAVLLANAPAYNASLRQPGVREDWRIPEASALYDSAAYQFHQAYGFIADDGLGPLPLETRRGLARPATALANSERAHALLTVSLAQSPGDAHAWTLVAWAAAMRGDLAYAEIALARSRALAPAHLELAYARLALSDILAGLRDFEEQLVANGDLHRQGLVVWQASLGSSTHATARDRATIAFHTPGPMV